MLEIQPVRNTAARVVAAVVAATTIGLALSAAPPAGAQAAPAVGERLEFKPANARARASLSQVPDLRDIVATEFSIALADLDGDGTPEMVVRSDSRMHCGNDGACATVVIQQNTRDRRIVTLLKNQNTLLPLAVTRDAVNKGWRALAVLDESGKVAKGERPGTPMYGKPMLYTMTAPAPAAR